MSDRRRRVRGYAYAQVGDHEVSNYKDELTPEEIRKIYKEYYSNKRSVESGETYRSQAPSSFRRKRRVARRPEIG